MNCITKITNTELLLECETFVSNNLAECCQELLVYRDSTVLKQYGKVRQLISMFSMLDVNYYQAIDMAIGLIQQLAISNAARPTVWVLTVVPEDSETDVLIKVFFEKPSLKQLERYVLPDQAASLNLDANASIIASVSTQDRSKEFVLRSVSP
jgi:hypothetical protein